MQAEACYFKVATAAKQSRTPPLPKDKTMQNSAESVSLPSTAQAAPVHRTDYAILGAISFSHLLNDMIQSLILAIYPILKSGFHLSLRADRPDHAHLSGNGLAAAAAGGHGHRSQADALFVAGGDGLHALRFVVACYGAEFCACCWLPPHWSAPVRRYSIRSPRAWRGWPRVGSMDWRNRYFR